MDAAAFAESGQGDFANRALAGSNSLFRTFDAMTDGVARQMHERFANGVGQRLIDFDVSPDNLKLDFFPQLSRCDSSRAYGRPLEHLSQRHQSQFDQTLFEFDKASPQMRGRG